MSIRTANVRNTTPKLRKTTVLACVVLLLPLTTFAQARPVAKTGRTDAVPRPAIPAILGAFNRYEVVAMPEAHGMKDMDDLIFQLIRNPGFPKKVNDIAVECGNSLYQPILDRYIAGENVPFTEIQKVWRNTTQPMCGESRFFEEFFPLVRAVNQGLAPKMRLRVLAGDPPVDWDQVKNLNDLMKFGYRDVSIASVMENQVLAKHQKCLMLFGTAHLYHGPLLNGHGNAVRLYEQKYPHVTFVISDLDTFDGKLPTSWPFPSLVLAKGTWLGALDYPHFMPPFVSVDENCHVSTQYPKRLQQPMENFVDAFLYLGPEALQLKEQPSSDIGFDVDYIHELQRREALQGIPDVSTTVDAFDRHILEWDEDALLTFMPPDLKAIEQDCLDRKKNNHASQ